MDDISRTDSETNLFFNNLSSELKVGDGDVEALLLREYGAVFVARGGAVPPDRIIFQDGNEVDAFQKSLASASDFIGGFEMTLQAAAMAALKGARDEAKVKGLSITPRGADSAKRTYGATVELWTSRVEPALDHWVGNGTLSLETAAEIRSLPPSEQVPEVLKLETKGIWFAKDLSKSIIYSVAPPGTSQHLAMLAFDVGEFADAAVRSILSAYGWHRTVVSDLPHFTFLGVREPELPTLGLKKTTTPDGDFWVPDI